MRKGILLLFVLTTLNSFANINVDNHSSEVFGFENRHDDAVTFFERGIRFHVFLNGDFDFDSRFFRTRRNRRVPILRDWQGRISRVGNVRIRYDFRGNVRRIGRVTMSYRRGLLRRVGNLSVDYNRWGDPLFFGNVGFDGFYNDYYYGNAWNANIGVGFNWNVGPIWRYNDPFFYGNRFRNNYRRVREDGNYIYYRANQGANVSGDRIVRRRKPSNGQTVRGRRDGSNTNNATNQRRRSVQNESTNNNRRRPVQSESNNNRRRSVENSSTNNRRRSIQNESNTNRRRSNATTSQERRKRVERTDSTKKRSSQVNRTNKKKREVRNATTPSKRSQNEVKRRRS